MTCIIIDDELSARAIVRKMCAHTGEIDVVAEFENAIDAIKFLNREPVDFVFLDIHMPGFTGFDFLETVRHPPRVIFTTSDAQFALESYEYPEVIDYLVKPIQTERFAKSIEKVRRHIFSNPAAHPDLGAGRPQLSESGLYVNIDKRLIKIQIDTIQVIEAEGDYIKLKAGNEVIRVHTTLKSIYEKLPKGTFLQIHRSYVINLQHIVDIEDNSVLIGKSVIPIGRSRRPELMRRLNLL